jgi:CubicO group peptidase (beta-lactamase class C family)
MKIGLGWHILQSETGQELIWHNGGTGGYSSSMAINMAEKVAVIILSNVSAFYPASGNIDRLCFALIRHAGK